jgi:hypothetical protein
MAYTGGVKFIDDLFGDLEIFTPPKFCKGDTTEALITDVWKFNNTCCLGEKLEEDLEKTHRQILDSHGDKVGWVSFDIGNREDFHGEQSIVRGKKRKADGTEIQILYILLIRQSEKAENEYKRVGIGIVHQGCLLRQHLNVRIM